MCFRVVRAHIHLSANSQQVCAQKHRFQELCPKNRRLQALSALTERPVESQEPHSSNVMTDTRTSDNELLNTVDDPQTSIAHETDLPEAIASSGHAQGSSYTKAERANLANIPESQMTPEMLRRWRISKANKGKQAWNKGRQHRPGSQPQTADI